MQDLADILTAVDSIYVSYMALCSLRKRWRGLGNNPHARHYAAVASGVTDHVWTVEEIPELMSPTIVIGRFALGAADWGVRLQP